MNEADTRARLIDPTLKKSGWNSEFILRECYFTDGRKIVGNKRGKRCFADYILRYKNINLAIIEAKSESKEPTEGLQQVIDYGTKLNVKFLYSTNGHKIYEFDLETGKGNFITEFPTPEKLFSKTFSKNNLEENLINEPYHILANMRPRYYQENAVNNTMKAIANNKKKILLTLATGTGKTYIAFQIVYKLLNAKWNLDNTDRRARILFLADRNVLADQAMNTFNPIEKDIIKINGEEIRRRNGVVPTNAFVFFAIYQAISEKENIGGFYKNYPKDFFDLVIIDECHRGSANEIGTWRHILDYFGKAVHIGLTATPKRNDNVDTYQYFGKPVYRYSLKEGINDGFLSPFKVKRVKTNINEYIFTNEDKIISGEVEQKMYKIGDFNKKIILPDRIKLIAKSILNLINKFDKTIVFCTNQSHALSLRDAINEFKQVRDPYYCVRVTSDEGILGRQLLERFQDNDKDIPVILTSSQMLTTGIDARNVRNIVLIRSIGTIVEFKQIVGRGTRVFDGKDFFTIIDYTGASEYFYDDDWDGVPEDIDIVIEPEPPDGGDNPEPPLPPDPPEPPFPPEPPVPPTPPEPPKDKLIIELSNGRKLKIIDIETRYIDEKGIPLTAVEFLEKLIGVLPNLFDSEEQLRKLWSNPDTREKVLKQLADLGFNNEQLETLREMFNAKDCDIFDILEHISYKRDMITRKTRVIKTKEREQLFQIYSHLKAKEFLHFILDRYQKDGIKELKRKNLSDLIKLNKLGTTKDAAIIFGGNDKLISAFYDLQKEIYNF